MVRAAFVLSIALAIFNVEGGNISLDEDSRPGTLLEEKITILLAI